MKIIDGIARKSCHPRYLQYALHICGDHVCGVFDNRTVGGVVECQSKFI